MEQPRRINLPLGESIWWFMDVASGSLANEETDV
jgi:hypothetical protein